MKFTAVFITCLTGLLQVGVGCHLSLDNSTGWVFPILSGIATLALGLVTASEE